MRRRPEVVAWQFGRRPAGRNRRAERRDQRGERDVAARRHRHREVSDHCVADRARSGPPGDGRPTARRPAKNEPREMLVPHNAVVYSSRNYDYYQPEAYIAQTDTYIEKDSSINDDVGRLRHSATSALSP